MTIALVWGSYSYNYVRIGTVVLYLHDLSDIMVDLLKLTNYMKQLAIHVSMTLFEVWILYYDGGGEPWLDEYWSFWIPCAARNATAQFWRRIVRAIL